MGRFSNKHVAGCFFTGAALGAVVALLYAPKTGTQTRKDIRKFSKKTVNQLDDLQSDFRAELTERYEQMLEVFDNVKDYVEDGKNKLQKMIRTA